MRVQVGRGRASSMEQAATRGKQQKLNPQSGRAHSRHFCSQKSLQKLHWKAINGSGDGQTRMRTRAPLQQQQWSLKRLPRQDQSSPVLYHPRPAKEGD